MKVDGVRICPACGARNKAAWEFCARCSEPLGDVPLGSDAEVATVSAPEATEDVVDDAPGSYGMPLLAVAAAVIAGWAALSIRGSENPKPPSTGLTFATLPASTPPYSPAPEAPGRAQFEEGRRLLARGQAAEAAVLLAAAVEAAPEDAEFREIFGQALIASGYLDRGFAQLETAVHLDPSSADHPRALARALSRAGRTGAAMAAYRQSVAIPPTNVETIRELANLYMRGDRFQDAAALLRRAADHRPDDLVLKQELGHALQRNGDPEGAARIYEEILSAAPQAHLTRGLLAETRIAEGRFDDAIALFQAGLARDAAAPLLHRGLASALERAGRDVEAAAEYREYARLAPGAADAQELAARAAALERRAAPAS